MQTTGAALVDHTADFGHQSDRFDRRKFGLAQRSVGMVERHDNPEVGRIARDPQMGVDTANG